MPAQDEAGLVGTARVAEPGHLPQGRFRPGDVAVLDLPRLDSATADRLLARRPSAVLLAGPCVSDTHPHRGAETLLEAGVVLVDELGPDLLGAVKDGTTVRVEAGRVLVGAGRDRWVDTEVPLHGQEQHPAQVRAALRATVRAMTEHVEGFAEATAAVLAGEQQLLLEGTGVPEVPVRLAGRPAVVCTSGYGHEADLRRLRHFVRDRRPVLIGVDGGADALLRAGLRPDVVVTDGDGHDVAGPEVVSSGAHVVVHTRTGAGPDVVGDPGATRFPSRLTTEDTAILLAHGNGASTVVTVGSHATMSEFLDRGRTGAASSFLTRLRVGSGLVDASTAAQLHQPRRTRLLTVLLVLALLLAVAATVAATPWGQEQLATLAEAARSWSATASWWPPGG